MELSWVVHGSASEHTTDGDYVVQVSQRQPVQGLVVAQQVCGIVVGEVWQQKGEAAAVHDCDCTQGC